MADVVAPRGRSHVIKGVIVVLVRLCVEYLLAFKVVFIEEGPLNLHRRIVELNLPSRRSPMVVPVMLLRPICVLLLQVVEVARCVVEWLMVLREVVIAVVGHR